MSLTNVCRAARQKPYQLDAQACAAYAPSLLAAYGTASVNMWSEPTYSTGLYAANVPQDAGEWAATRAEPAMSHCAHLSMSSMRSHKQP